MSALPPGVPGYWPNEQSGVLRPVVEKYLRGDRLSARETTTMREYLRQWIAADFYGPGVDALRHRVHGLESDADVRAWLADAMDMGIDPL